MTDKKDPSSIADILKKYEPKRDGKYISREFQDYGYRLAVELNDLSHKSLYIRMAKTVNRKILEMARSFCADAPNVRSKGRLFMWKVKELKIASKNK